MSRYIIKRILLLIPVMLGVSLLVFVLMDLAPGNVVDMISEGMTDEQVEQLYREYNLDRSVFYRYFVYMKDLLRGDLGESLVFNRPVWELYLQRIPATMYLALGSMAICIVLSIPLGIKAATTHGSLTDNICSVLGMLGLSIPNFWLGLMLMVLFGLKLHWFPASGYSGPTSLVLPAFTLGTGMMAILMRTTRSSMLDVLRQDYLRTARAKGVPEKDVVNKHGLRNALIPIITIIGTQLGTCFGGSTVTENVFSFPGVGRLLIDSIKQRDTNAVTGCLIMTTMLISIIQMLVDIAYAYADPRLKGRYAKPKKIKEGKEK